MKKKFTQDQKTWALETALLRRTPEECPFTMAGKILDFIYLPAPKTRSGQVKKKSQ